LAPARSTSRDVILTGATKYGPGVLRLISSLRQTGCRARIFIFTFYDTEFPPILLECGVTLVFAKPSTRSIRSPFKIRWEWYYSFLRNHTGQFDRVFHTDAFDAFFFEDPFNFAGGPNDIYFQVEDRPIRDCPYNKLWVLGHHYDINRYKLISNIIACSGSLLAGVAPFLRFAELMVTHPEWPFGWGHGYDQGDFNYVLYSIFQLEEKWKIHEMGCNSGFLTMQYCSQWQSAFFSVGNKTLLVPNSSRNVSYVHQYNRYPAVDEWITRICTLV
jgi:hypothetical protein